MTAKHRVGLYLLLASLSNFVVAKEDAMKHNVEWDYPLDLVMNELYRKLKLYFNYKSDYDTDMNIVTKSLGKKYETTNPLTLALNLVSRYLELKAEYKPVFLTTELRKTIIDFEDELYESWDNDLVKRTTDASDALVNALKNHLEQKYRKKTKKHSVTKLRQGLCVCERELPKI